MTKKTTLTLSEIYTLDSELGGVTDPQTGEKRMKGLLAQSLNLKTKFWLTKLKTQTAEVVATVNKLKDETVIKHGTKDENGNVSIPMMVTEDEVQKINPAFVAFNAEFNDLISESKELEHQEFNVDDFNLETDENYPVFYKLLGITE